MSELRIKEAVAAMEKETQRRAALYPELLKSLKDLYGQVMQAKIGFDIYSNSPSMEQSMNMAKKVMEKAEALLRGQE